jgi:hypothetical protein
LKYENSGLLAHSHMFNRWKNYFSQLLNVHRVCEVRLLEMETTEPVVCKSFEAEIARAN